MESDLSQQRVHFFNLDVLRFVAAFMIVVFHGHLAYSGWFAPPPFLASESDPKQLSLIGKFFQPFLMNLDMGVDFFFLISGFLITYLLLHEKKSLGKINIKNFYIRRILRIWPLYFLIVLLTPLLIRLSDESQPDYWWTVFFMNNFYTINNLGAEFPFVHFWSVCIEEHYYLFWPLIIAFVPYNRLPLCFSLIIISSIVFRALAFSYSPDWYMHISYSTFSKMDVLAIGSWLGYLHMEGKTGVQVNKIAQILFILLFLLVLFIGKSQAGTLFLVCFKKYIFIGGFVFIFMNYMFNPKSFLVFKSKNLIHYLGKISYGIYMYHNILFPFIIKKIMWPMGNSNFYLFIGIYFSLILLLSIISYELFEKHFLKLKDRFALIKTSR